MYRKNVASQNLPFVLINASTGAALTGATVTARRSIDGGAQATATGSVSELANGQYNLALSQADTNGNNIGILLTAASAIPVHFTLVTTAADPTDTVRFGLTALPNAAAAASGGLPILGANATAISFTGGMTISNAAGDALTLSSGGSNGVGLSAAGNGTGAGIRSTGGATGHGVSAVGGATSGDGISAAAATSGHGLTATGVGTTKHGVNATGGSTTSHGIAATGGGVGHGILATSGGGATGDGIRGTAASTNGNGLNGIGVGTGAGLLATGGATGIGLSGVGGATSGAGIKATGSAGNAIGLQLVGQGSAAGLNATGGATGHGAAIVGGGTSGDGVNVTTTNGHGLNLAPAGTSKHGLFATGGNAGTSDGISAVAGTGGVPIRGDLTGNVTGNLSGSVGSVTGAVGSVTGSVGGNVTGSVGSVASGGITTASFAAGAINAAAIGADAITAAKIATNAIDADALATDAVTEIQSGLATSAALVTAQADLDDIQTRLPAALVSGRIDASVGAMAAGTVTAAAVATGAIDADALAADAVAEIADGVWDEAIAGHLTAGSTGLALNSAGSAGDPWSTVIPGAYGAGTAGHRLGNVPDLVAGAAGGLFIAGSNAATTVNITGNVTGNLSGSVGSVTGAVGSVTGNVGGNVTGSVGSVASGGISSASFAAGAINAAAVATGAIDADALATDAVAEIADGVWDEAIAGHLGAGSTGLALNSASSAGDPWATTIPGAYGAGTAGHRLGALPDITAGAAGGVFIAGSNAATTVNITGNLSGNVTGSVGSMAAGGITSASFAAGAIDNAAIAADAIGASELATSAVNEIADGVWDEGLAGHLAVGSTGEALSNASAAGDPWAIAIPAAYGAGTAGHRLGALPDVTAGAAGGVFIAGTNAATMVNVTGNLTGNVSGSVGSVAGNVVGSVGSVAAGGIAAASFAAGAINAAAIATDAIDADAVASNAVAEIQAGLATSSALSLIQTDVDDIQTRLPAALVSGRMDSSVGGYQSGQVPLQPTVAGRTLDVAATGEAGLDFDNVKDASAPHTLTNITVPTVTNITNAPPDSAGVTTLLIRIPAALFTGITSLAQWLGAIAGKQVANSTARTEIRATGAGSGTFDETTDSVEAIRDSQVATGAAMTLTAGERNAVADALLDRNMATGTDSGSASVRTVRQALRFLRNKRGIVGPTLTVYKEDDVTSSYTATVTTSPTAELTTDVDPA